MPAGFGATRHRYADVNGRQVFYREAGDPARPAIVLLHGAPASSFMYRNLIPLLAGDYYVIAPDYLGFGLSDVPAVDEFDYTFDTLTYSVETLLRRLNISRYAIYVQDYGAPVGWRLALRNPDAISAVITQNGNAYVEGFVSSFWEPLWAYAADPNPETEQPIRDGLTLDAIRRQYTHGEPEPDLVSPDTWHHDHSVLQRSGDPAIWRPSWHCCGSTGRTSCCTRPCTNGCAPPRFPCWLCGGATTRSSVRPGLRPSEPTSRTCGSNCWRVVTSCSRRTSRRSPRSSSTS
jgi:pimeloyl-ACP methyl ester carboxylesterase